MLCRIPEYARWFAAPHVFLCLKQRKGESITGLSEPEWRALCAMASNASYQCGKIHELNLDCNKTRFKIDGLVGLIANEVTKPPPLVALEQFLRPMKLARKSGNTLINVDPGKLAQFKDQLTGLGYYIGSDYIGDPNSYRAVVLLNTLFASLRHRKFSLGKLIPIDGLNTGQKAAFKNAVTHPLSMVTGPAGVGKSALIAALAKQFGSKLMILSFVAAQLANLEPRVRGTGVEMMTIHLFARKYGNIRNSLSKVRFLIVEEFSNLSPALLKMLAEALLHACPRLARICFVGDPKQLDPIDPGSTLWDCKHIFKITTLTHNYRIKDPGSALRVMVNACQRAVLAAEHNGRLGPNQRMEYQSIPAVPTHRDASLRIGNVSLEDWLQVSKPEDQMQYQIICATNKECDLWAKKYNTAYRRKIPTIGKTCDLRVYMGGLIEVGRKYKVRRNTRNNILPNGTVIFVVDVSTERMDPKGNVVIRCLSGHELVVSLKKGDLHPKDLQQGDAITIYSYQGREADHILVTNPAKLNVKQWYVAASRARMSLTANGLLRQFPAAPLVPRAGLLARILTKPGLRPVPLPNTWRRHFPE